MGYEEFLEAGCNPAECEDTDSNRNKYYDFDSQTVFIESILYD